VELMPEKRYLFFPNLSKVVGSTPLQERVEALRPDIHLFGHTHFGWDQTIDGVRYMQVR
jgi:Icc-related predicted phosphoesterase